MYVCTSKNHISNLLFFCFFYAVPIPIVYISLPDNNLTTGQSLTIDCTVAAVNGITSSVDIVWYYSSLSVTARRVNDVTPIINGTTAVYRDSFVIPSLTRQHDGAVYVCQAVVNSEPLLQEFSFIRLNVTCKLLANYKYSV